MVSIVRGKRALDQYSYNNQYDLNAHSEPSGTQVHGPSDYAQHRPYGQGTTNSSSFASLASHAPHPKPPSVSYFDGDIQELAIMLDDVGSSAQQWV